MQKEDAKPARRKMGEYKMHRGFAAKIVVLSAVLTVCITSVGISAEQRENHITSDGTKVVTTDNPIEVKKPDKVIVEHPQQFGRIAPVAVENEEEVMEDDGEATDNTEDAGTEEVVPEEGDGTGEVDEPEYRSSEADEGIPSDVQGYSDGDEGSEQEPYPAETGDTVEEVIEEPVSVPEDSTYVEEPVEEEQVLVEEPVVEEPVEDEWIYYGNCRVTHYCSCPKCTGPWYGSATASGAWPTELYTVAAGEDLPFGTQVLINGNVYVVQDRGVGYGQIDIFVGEDHQYALDLGEYYAETYIKYPE